MIAFQDIKTGRFLCSSGTLETSPLLADAYLWAECDEARLRRERPFLQGFHTVIWSSRIDHSLNSLDLLTREELAKRYPSTLPRNLPGCKSWLGYAPMQDGKTCVRVCSYCPDAAIADHLARTELLAVTHGICVQCYQKQMAEILGEDYESPLATD